MSSRKLILSNPPKEFTPFIKLTKKEQKYVSDDWHHAELTVLGYTPSNDERFNDCYFEVSEVFAIIRDFGLRPSSSYDRFWDEVDINISDDDLYELAKNRKK